MHVCSKGHIVEEKGNVERRWIDVDNAWKTGCLDLNSLLWIRRERRREKINLD